MSDIGEGIGSAIEGGLLGRAVEKRDGEGQRSTPGPCLNCGARLIGAHCHNCGQKAQIHRTFGAIWHDIVHGVLHADGKLWRTLPLLAFKPGNLTRRYINGERAKFVSPMALFLFSVFLMFAVFQFSGLTPSTDLTPTEETVENIEKASDTARSEAETTRQALRERLNDLPADSPLRPEVQADLDNIDTAETILNAAENIVTISEEEDGRYAEMNTDVPLPDWFADGLFRKWQENPSLMLYKMQNNAYKFSWLLIPLSIPFVWVMFAWKRRFKAYDHAIFVTYSLAFMSLLFILLSAISLAGIGDGWFYAGLIFIPPIHIYKHLRGTYSLSRFSALWRLNALLVFILIVLILFLQALFLLGAF